MVSHSAALFELIGRFTRTGWRVATVANRYKAVNIFVMKKNKKSHITPRVLAYHLEGLRVPLVVRVPQVGNHWSKALVPLHSIGIYIPLNI